MNTRIIIAATMIVLTISMAYAKEPDSIIPPEVEKAAMVGDWGQIINLLKDVDPNSKSPVKRLIKGHACLATNRNNNSFRLFASATSVDLKLWENWSNNLVKKHPKNSYAHFYHADALARLEKREKAIAAFTTAIGLDTNNAYALHARGVLYTQAGNYSKAGNDLAEAQAISPDVADFHNSRGMLRIDQQKGNIVRLEQRFEKAAELSKDFALANHGLGCVALLRNPNSEIGSIEWLQRAHKLLPEASLIFLVNETDYRYAVIKKYASLVAMSAEDDKAGMAIKREIHLGKLTEMNDEIGSLRKKPDIKDSVLAKTYLNMAGAMVDHKISREVNSMNPMEVQNFRQNNPKAAHKTADATVRAMNNPINKFSRSAGETFSNVARYVKDFGIDYKKASVGLDMNNIRSDASNSLQRVQRDRLTMSGKVHQLRGAELYDSSKHVRDTATVVGRTPDNYRGTIMRFEAGPAQNPQQSGATTDKRNVVWDDMPWTFKPIFGLFYMPKSNNDSVEKTH